MKNNNDINKYIDIAKRVEIEPGLTLLFIDNNTNLEHQIEEAFNRSFVQIHFCIKGESIVEFNKKKNVALKANESVFSFNPILNKSINIKANAQTQLVSILISIRKLHLLFTSEAGLINFHSRKMKNQFYREKPIASDESIVLRQMTSFSNQNAMKELYLKAKIFELLSFYFQPKDKVTNCPFLQEEKNVEKIRLAKSIIIKRMAEPPSLQELADEIKLPLAYLKDGFKQIYGDTVYNFLIAYKMEYARRLLKTKKYNVAEIAYKVGYSTSSHFIAAFKKRFHITPKKYMGNKEYNK